MSQACLVKGKGGKSEMEYKLAPTNRLDLCPFYWFPICYKSVSNPERWCYENAALNMSANLENSAVATGLETVSFHSNPKERKCQRMLNYHIIGLISHASKVMLKILQTRLQQYVNCDLPDVQAGFRKGRGTGDQIANICWTLKEQESSRKTSISALLTMPKPLTVWITINCGKFWERWE